MAKKEAQKMQNGNKPNMQILLFKSWYIFEKIKTIETKESDQKSLISIC